MIAIRTGDSLKLSAWPDGQPVSGTFSATADVVASITDPGNRTTSFTYDNRGRRTHVDAPDTAHTNITVTAYNPDGRVSSVTGGQTYPVSYTYDYAGRMKTMTTTGSSGNAITAWNYSTTTGRLFSKRYNSNASGTTGSGPDYEYTTGGRLSARLWARPISTSDPTRVTTTYGYTWGRLTSISYNDGTPGIAYTYDNLGRSVTIATDGVCESVFAYDPATLALDTETVTIDPDGSGSLPALTRILDRSTDTLGRQSGTAVSAVGSSTPEHSLTYGYDDSGRLATVESPAGTFTYAYTPDSSLIASVTGPVHTVTNTWETNRDVLDVKENKIPSTNTVISAFDYGVNNIGQRTGVASTGTAFPSQPADWTWGYDALGQVVSADSPDNNRDRAYEYDQIGNRVKSADSLTLPTTNNYSPNKLNQYNSHQIGLEWQHPAYDPDGNMTSGHLPVDGIDAEDEKTLAYDGENRLRVAYPYASNGFVATYTYDGHSRRVARTVTYGNSTTATTIYLYDGWNCMAEYTLQNSSYNLHTSLTWGLDLSGSLQGAGGVGGLLAVTKHQAQSTTHFFPTYDGNGNVSEYLSTAGANVVHYEYDPFGTLTRRTGSTATRYQYRFSTKPRDPVSGLYYYGYRWYDPYTGRWINRDPIEERGGVNLYGFVSNDGILKIDTFGLEVFEASEVCCCLEFYIREPHQMHGDPGAPLFDPYKRGGSGPELKLPNKEKSLPVGSTNLGMAYVLGSKWKDKSECKGFAGKYVPISVEISGDAPPSVAVQVHPRRTVELINAGDMSMVIPNDPKVRLRAIREFRLGDASPKPIDGTTGPSPIEAASAASVRQTFASIGAEVPEVRYLYTRKIVYGKTACYSTQFYLNPNSKNPKDLGLGTTPGPELEEFVKKQPP